jgi:urea transport system permease protein
MLGFCHRLLALVFASGMLLGMLALPTVAHAGPYEDALARFVTDDFDDTTEAITGVAASGNPLAAAVLGALLDDGRLVFSAQAKKVFFRDSSGQLIDAATGQPVTAGAPADLAPVQINNRLRRVIEAALGALTLMVGEPDKRLEAAQAVFQSRDASCRRSIRPSPRRPMRASNGRWPRRAPPSCSTSTTPPTPTRSRPSG